MTNVISSLRTALLNLLLADEQLITNLGGQNIFVIAPPGQSFPYITFGKATAEDWRASELMGHHQVLLLEIWSREGGDQEALNISRRAIEILDGAKPALSGHRLIDLRVLSQTIDPVANSGVTHAQISIEAYTEISV